jgi:uncharacterized peroxidase-related enzyme
MRLDILKHGHSPLQKVQLWILGALAGRALEPVLMMSYRRNFFGKYWARCLQEGLRQAHEWSVGELEIFAAFVSGLNRCRFWIASHTAVAVKRLGPGSGAKLKAILDDWQTAPIDARLRAALTFLKKLTLTPDAIGAEDVKAARAAGINDEALYEAIYVCFLFSTMDRLADALGFEVAGAGELNWAERILRQFGYARMSVPG